MGTADGWWIGEVGLMKAQAAEGLTDPKKLEENEYWQQRYGHKRWDSYYIDQSTGVNKQLLRGLAAWSGVDPLKEERVAGAAHQGVQQRQAPQQVRCVGIVQHAPLRRVAFSFFRCSSCSGPKQAAGVGLSGCVAILLRA